MALFLYPHALTGILSANSGITIRRNATLLSAYSLALGLITLLVQTLPTVVIGLYTRWFHRWALIAGWAVGMALGTVMATSQGFAAIFPLQIGSFNFAAYTALYALAANLIVTIILTPILSALGADGGEDETSSADYEDIREVEPEEQAQPSGDLAR